MTSCLLVTIKTKIYKIEMFMKNFCAMLFPRIRKNYTLIVYINKASSETVINKFISKIKYKNY